jgi:hypothetical protein
MNTTNAPYVCSFCKKSSYGCTPGRCFSPRSKMSDEKPKSAEVGRAPSLGEKRVVLSWHLRTGGSGGTILVMELDCGHEVWRRIGKRKPSKPRTTQCIGCGSSLNAGCACGCGKVADVVERMSEWVWFRGQWFAPGHGHIALARAVYPKRETS